MNRAPDTGPAMTTIRELLSREMALIEAELACALANTEELPAAEALRDAAQAAVPAVAPGRKLAARLGLDPFARDVLLLAAGVHLSPRIGSLCAQLTGDRLPRVTAAIAMTALPGADWHAFRPDAPLRALRCLRYADPDRPTISELIVDERLLLALLGQNALDERVAALVQAMVANQELTASARSRAQQLVRDWRQTAASTPSPVIHLRRDESQGADARALANEVAQHMGLNLHVLSDANLPVTAAERHGFAALWRREALLGAVGLLIELGDDPDPARQTLVGDIADRLEGLVIVSGGSNLSSRRHVLSCAVPRPDQHERHLLWTQSLGPETARRLNGATEALAEQFELPGSDILRIGMLARGLERDAAQALLRSEARTAAQARIAACADVIRPAADWQDLVLPDEMITILKGLVAQVRHRSLVHGDWGFAGQGGRGLGIAALFAGPSGTGKTLSAEVIAHALCTDLVRVDLAGVVSKYIGETEKNLKRVFAAAEGSGAVLLFDEADALFGKRSEVANAHDRYANIEVSYLLQRMESYTGLAILTTNQREALDNAFYRRLRFILHFPFPDEVLRRSVWERVFPPEAATERLNFDQLARLNVAPGNIRTIAINAAFLAAQDGAAVSMRHLYSAALNECAKLERPVTAAELGDWL